jgi:hypothetical protein
MASEARIEPRAAPIGISEPGVRSLVRVGIHLIWTRAVLWGVADYAVHAKQPRLHPSALHDFGVSALAAILRWDTWWYVSVVEDGYSFSPHDASNAAFLPGFPALIALGRPVFGSAALASLFVANAAFVAAIFAFWSWVRYRAGLVAAERAALFLLVYPFSFFFDCGYSESSYFLWCTLALHAFDRERRSMGGVYASLAALTRPMGLFLAPAFAWSLVRSRGTAKRMDVLAFSSVLGPLVALGSFAAYLWRRCGSPFALWTAQRVGWGVGEHFSPLRASSHVQVFRQLADVFTVAAPIPLAWFAFRSLGRLGPVAGVYAILTTLVAISVGGDSVGREALAVVPIFAMTGLVRLGGKSALGLQAASFALLVVFTYAFVLGHFMG